MNDTDNSIFMFIGDRAFTIKDLGPAADMKIGDAMQSIIDQGLLGDQLKGTPWNQVIKPSSMGLEAIPGEDDVLCGVLHGRYKDHLEICRQAGKDGTLTDAHKVELVRLRKKWQTAAKLTKD